MKVLHIANWYPNPWSAIEGNFIRDQIRLFTKEVPGQAVVVKVRHDRDFLLRPRILDVVRSLIGYIRTMQVFDDLHGHVVPDRRAAGIRR